METYTVAKVIGTYPANHGQVRCIFTTNETGEQSNSGFFDAELKSGQQLEGEIVDKSGTNKDGQPVTYHNFQAPRKGGPRSSGGGISEAQFGSITTALNAILAECRMIRGLVDQTTSDGNPIPDFSKPVTPEEESIMRSAEAAMA